MNEADFNLSIFSPRWGHEENYIITLKNDLMTISINGRRAICTYREGLDPMWSYEFGKNSLIAIMNNDSIYPPEILPNMFEYVWESWRKGEIDDSFAKEEFEVAVNWLNEITKSKPRTDFWMKYF